MMTIQYRLIAWAGFIGIAAMLLTGAAFHFEGKGRAAADKEWLAKVNALRAAYAEKDAAQVRLYQSIERKTSEDHQTEVAKVRADAAADRADVDRRGGLRIVAPVCPSGGPAATTPAAGASRRDEAGPATIRLPQQVENDLWAIADDADEVSAQLRACQGWIRDSGFYGTVGDKNPQLLGRIVAAKNKASEVLE